MIQPQENFPDAGDAQVPFGETTASEPLDLGIAPAKPCEARNKLAQRKESVKNFVKFFSKLCEIRFNLQMSRLFPASLLGTSTKE